MPTLLALLLLQEGTATVTGIVELGHRAPPCETIEVDGPASKVVFSEELAVDDRGRVQWALVFVSKGLEGRDFAVPATCVPLVYSGGQLRPKVLGIIAGQELSPRLDDASVHNLHVFAHLNGETSRDAMPEPRSFFIPERAIQVGCDVHPSETAWIQVLSHPFFAVTNDDGRFEIKGLPPGRYTLETWQEKCKSQSREIEVKAGETATVRFFLETVDPPPPFPWQPAAVGAGTLLVLGIVFALLLRRTR